MTNKILRNKFQPTKLRYTGLIAALMVTTLLCGCTERPAEIAVTVLDNPSGSGARLPRLTTTESGALLSYVEPAPEPDAQKYRLRFASFAAGKWSAPTTVSSGSDWFINWADFPSVYRTSTGQMAAHWLQRSSAGTYSYDVKTSLSPGGTRWSAPYTPHLDGTRTEHGFASYFSVGKLPAIVWLDGRHTQAAAAGTSDGHAEHAQESGADGAMTLRMRTLETASAEQPSTLLDDRVCDCCQTAAINTASGPIVFYRDRSIHEIRDISFVYLQNNSWTQPAPVSNDGWEITGCPVNGPQADTLNDLVAVAWFTAAGGSPAVKLAFSRQINTGFEEPLIVSQEAPLGRLDMTMLANHTALVAWLEDSAENMAEIRAALFDGHGRIGNARIVARISGARASGFLQLARVAPDTALLAYTDVDNDRITTVLLSGLSDH